jgi:hypothetical protein
VGRGGGRDAGSGDRGRGLCPYLHTIPHSARAFDPNFPCILLMPLSFQEDFKAEAAVGAAVIHSEAVGVVTGVVVAGAFDVIGCCIFQTCKWAFDSFGSSWFSRVGPA